MKLHSRIDQSDENVGEQVPEHNHDRAHHQYGHQDRIVAGIQRIDEQETHARPTEHRLRHQRAADQKRKLKPREGDERSQRRAKGVVEQNCTVGEAFRAGRSDIILVRISIIADRV